MRHFLLLLLLITAFPVTAQVVDSGSFSIRLFGLIDVTAPSTPVLLSATPIASTQIDITWGVSTDDYYLYGYVVARNGTPIATTTQTSFSDVGLLASTTYEYTVTAVDSAFNYSSTSNSIATTTPNPPVSPVATSTRPTSGTAVRTVLETFSLVPASNTATIELTTANPARIEIRWGRTGSYELGYMFNETYVRDFKSTITDLEPGTRYEYEVIGYSPRNIPTVLKRGQFTTLSEMSIAPINVRYFNANVSNKDVLLDWGLPEGDVAYVRLLRSNLGYPVTPTDGAIVYQGLGTSFSDKAILEKFSPAYYTIFVYDSFGNISSGAILRVALDDSGDGIILPPSATTDTPIRNEDGVEIFTPAATTTDPGFDPVVIRIPNSSEIKILTETSSQSFKDSQIIIANDQVFVISIPASSVAKNLKTLIVSFTHPTEKQEIYSYILRLNKDSSAYEATINPLYVSGQSQFTVAIYDYEARIVSRYQKRITFGDVARGERDVFFPDYLFAYPEIIYGFSGLVLAVILLLLWWRRRR